MQTPKADEVRQEGIRLRARLKQVKEALKDDLNNSDLRYEELVLQGKIIQLQRSNAFLEALVDDIQAQVPQAKVEIKLPDECPVNALQDQEQHELQLQSNLQS